MANTLKTTTIQNGLRIATVADPNARTATAMVLVGVGSSYESKTENGLSHFLEHVCFKGTIRRPSAKLLIEEVESLGAVTNAFTDRECTGYHIKGNPAHMDVFVDILADIYQNSTFPAAELEKEKGVVIEEMNMYEDMPQQKVGDILFETLYPDQAAGRSILGTKDTVRGLTRDTLLSYKRKFYTPNNTVIVFSGKVSHATVVSLVKKYFADLKPESLRKKPKTKDMQTAAQYRILRKPLDQAHFILGFRSVSYGNKDLTAIRLLATILGRGMSSRLSLLVRESLGAAYYIYAQQDTYLDHGVFGIGAGIDRTRLSEIMGHIIGECIRLKEELVPLAELNKAKEYSIGTLQLGLEGSEEVAMYYGLQLVLQQEIKTPEQLMKEIKALTAKDLQRAAKKLFVSNKATLAIVGPFKNSDVRFGALKKL